MTLGKRLARVESKVMPDGVTLVMSNGVKRWISAASIVEAHGALMKRSEEWHRRGGAFPLPDCLIDEVPNLRMILGSMRVEGDLPKKFPNAPVGPIIASIRFLIEQPPRQVLRDAKGEYMMLPALIGLIRVSFVRPSPKEA